MNMSESKGKVVVFGGSGFLGSHVADQLTDAGYQVVIFDMVASRYLRDTQEMVVGDVLDRELIAKTIKGSKYVYHFAAIADIKEAQERPTDTIQTNIMSTALILEACLKHRIERVIYGSTIYVYSTYGSFYRSSKQASELIIENYHEIHNLDYTILRYGSLYGPRANNFNLVRRIITQALKTGEIIRAGNGKELREYIHVIDAAKASVEVLSSGKISSNILITGSVSMRIRDFLGMVNEIFENKLDIKYVSEENAEKHYYTTPYTFKPKVAKRYPLKYNYDLGQGILDQIYEVYEKLLSDGEIEDDNRFTRIG